MTKHEHEQILTDFGLEFSEIEQSVYKIKNTGKEVDVDQLKCALQECALMVSDDIRSVPHRANIYTTIAYVYYVVTDYNNRDVIHKYDDISCSEHEKSYLMHYRCNPKQEYSIDTVYQEDET